MSVKWRARRYTVTRRLRGPLVAAGLLKYKARYASDYGEWSEAYASGFWDYLSDVEQLARYCLLAGYIEFFECRSVLDVGCGHGVLRATMRSVEFDRYVGIDPVPNAVSVAQQLADSRSEFLVGDVFLPALDTFDAVVCNEVLYYVEDVDAMLARLCELVKPGGYLLTSHVRHSGDAGLYRMIGQRLELVEELDLSNDTPRGRRRRRVCVYRRASETNQRAAA